MKHGYDAVVFDLDGTLTRSAEGIIKSASYAIEKMGLPVPEKAELLKFIGPPLTHSFMEFMGMSQEQALQAQSIYRERYNVCGLFENEVYTGIPRLLRQLKKKGVYLAVATGKPQEPAERILAHFGLAKYFDEVVGTGGKAMITDKKLLISTALKGAQPQNAVMVGDRKFDIEGANALKIDSIGVGYGYGTEDELKKAGCTHYAQTVEALSALLLPDNEVEKGIFITVEGPDGSGKTTQVEALEKNLKRFGYDVLRTREPGGCPISEKIRSVILDVANIGMSDMTEALLYAAARAQHVAQVIRPAVAAGRMVLCDRFVDSSITYQGGGRGLGTQTVSGINAYAVDGMMPDVTVYLDIGHKEALKRRLGATAPDRIEIETEAFHARVETAYKDLIKENADRYLVVDARGEKETIAQDCLSKLLKRLGEMEEGNLS